MHPHNVTAGPADYFAALAGIRHRLRDETELVILFDDSFRGEDVHRLVEFGESLGIPVSYIPLVDYSNSRGALDMGVVPGEGGMHLDEMLAADLGALWVVGANPMKNGAARKAGFLLVQDLFLTETAQQADVVLPAACAYEKNGTVTNTTGEVQRLKRALNTMGAKPDLEIMGFIAREMGVAAALGPWLPEAVLLFGVQAVGWAVAAGGAVAETLTEVARPAARWPWLKCCHRWRSVELPPLRWAPRWAPTWPRRDGRGRRRLAPGPHAARTDMAVPAMMTLRITTGSLLFSPANDVAESAGVDPADHRRRQRARPGPPASFILMVSS